MENSDVFASSTAPLTWHDFLERMRHPSAADFVKAIKSFIVSFLNNARDPERDSAAIQDFLSNMEAAFRAHSLWAGCSDEELDSAGEGLEKYVMTKLFNDVFASHPDEVNVDNQLHQKAALVQQFICPENLDILSIYQNETSCLHKKSCRKLICTRLQGTNLSVSSIVARSLITCCLMLPSLQMRILPELMNFFQFLFMLPLKRQSRLVSEAAYFFTNMLSAESFITNIGAKSLSMEESEYEKNMEFARALLFSPSDPDGMPSQSDQSVGPNQETNTVNKHQRAAAQAQVPHLVETKSRNDGSKPEDSSSLDKVPSISDLENRGATLLMKDRTENHVFQDFPYLYAKVGDLTMSDVEGLLDDYKKLVFKYVCLSKGLGAPISTPSSSDSQSRKEDHTKTVKETDGTRAVESVNEKHEDLFRTHDSSISSVGVSEVGVGNAEYKLTEDEAASAVASQGHKDDEN